jgi:hypothetical protein
MPKSRQTKKGILNSASMEAVVDYIKEKNGNFGLRQTILALTKL